MAEQIIKLLKEERQEHERELAELKFALKDKQEAF